MLCCVVWCCVVLWAVILTLRLSLSHQMWKLIFIPFSVVFFIFFGFVAQWLSQLFGESPTTKLSLGEYLLNSFLVPILIGWGQMIATIIVLYFLKLYACERCCHKKKGEGALLQDPDDSRTPAQEGEGGV